MNHNQYMNDLRQSAHDQIPALCPDGEYDQEAVKTYLKNLGYEDQYIADFIKVLEQELGL